ncbi:hypothetical protein B0H14DRAFT_3421991 [Mycena olivaceomarginata]|nr:hypothetical protein B0H14DRAFT_3421990 [Mycena olivaceomarginata]KAJ7903817.1 hypothetical protein B0H14DRAFT_3421991 [Mycena olivaceomarginata]
MPSNRHSLTDLLNGPLVGLPEDFQDFSFDTTGHGDDLEVEITQLPSERAHDVFADVSSPSPFFPSLSTRSPAPAEPLTLMGPPPTPTPARADVLHHPTHQKRSSIGDDLDFPTSPFDPIAWDATRFRDVNRRFEAANNWADIVLSVHQDRRDREDAARASPRPLADAAVNLPRSPLPSLQTTGPDPSNDDENGGKSGLTGDDLISIARACVDVNPFLAPYGKKGAAWEEGVTLAKKQKGFRHPKMTATAFQNRCEALVSFKKDPHGKNKKLASLIGDGTSAAITIGALLERMELQYDQSKDKSDDAKAALKQKNDADRAGGEAIRQASMRAMRRKRSPSPESDASNATEPDVDGTAPDAGTGHKDVVPAAEPLSASPSVEIIESGRKPAKRRRLTERRSASGKDALLEILKEDNKRRAEHDRRIAASLDTFVKDSREQKAEFTSLVRDLLTAEKK